MRPGRLDHRWIALHQLGHMHTLDTLLFLATLGLPLLIPPLGLLGNLLVERLAASERLRYAMYCRRA